MKTKKISQRQFQAHSQRLALESRLVFDGAAVATVAEVETDLSDDQKVTEANDNGVVPVAETTIDDKSSVDVQYQADNGATTDTQPTFFTDPIDSSLITQPVSGVSGEYSSTLIVVDPRAENAATLLAKPPLNTQVITLDINKDGFQQIESLLQERGDVKELHIITGSDGDKQWLGNKSLSASLDSSSSETLIQWGDSFADDAHIIFHGAERPSSQWINHVDALTGVYATWTQDSSAWFNTNSHEVIVVDTGIKDYQNLLNDINSNAEVLYIDSTKDGIKQLVEGLAGRTDISALHILSHGSEGQLSLGTTLLNSDTIAQYQDEFAQIGQALTGNSDILFYGCNVANGSAGIDFVKDLAELTKADVAASDDLTGSAEKSGDWTLEYNVGKIETASLSALNYANTLGFGTTSYNGDAPADPLRLITWNVIGLDSNKPAVSGPDTFMVGLRVDADASGLNNLVIKLVEDDGVDIFGGSLLIGDNNVPTDGSDGIDQIHFINKLVYTN